MKAWITLKNTKEFQKVYQERKSFANRYLIMYCAKNNLEVTRIGISVSKKVGNSVIRHRVTRLIRETFRLNYQKIVTGYDIVIVARDTIKDKSFYEVDSAFMHLIKLHTLKI
jgi:ribonuclease P protein component